MRGIQGRDPPVPGVGCRPQEADQEQQRFQKSDHGKLLPSVVLPSIVEGSGKSAQNLSGDAGLFVPAPVPPEEREKIANRQGKPAGLPEKRGGRSTAERAGKDGTGHRCNQARSVVQLPMFIIADNVTNCKGEFHGNLWLFHGNLWLSRLLLRRRACGQSHGGKGEIGMIPGEGLHFWGRCATM